MKKFIFLILLLISESVFAQKNNIKVGDIIETKIIQTADFEKGNKDFISLFYKELSKQNIQSENREEINLSFSINEKGEVKDIYTNEKNKKIKEQILNAFNSVDGKWKNGKFNGVNIISFYTIPIIIENK